MNYRTYIWALVLLTCFTYSKAQTATYTEQPSYSTIKGITVDKDPRLDILLERHKVMLKGVPRSGRGFRVQIYYGSDRDKARNIKIDFMHRHPDKRVYLTYIYPQYRVKVGNFITHKDAWDFYREISRQYERCMVVPDVIKVQTSND